MKWMIMIFCMMIDDGDFTAWFIAWWKYLWWSKFIVRFITLWMMNDENDKYQIIDDENYCVMNDSNNRWWIILSVDDQIYCEMDEWQDEWMERIIMEGSDSDSDSVTMKEGDSNSDSVIMEGSDSVIMKRYRSDNVILLVEVNVWFINPSVFQHVDLLWNIWYWDHGWVWNSCHKNNLSCLLVSDLLIFLSSSF